jgi:tRNA A-37 threonylcarbamoyl transferase component Bud32
MTPERWSEVKALFQRALEVPPGERERFLDRGCAGDAALRGEVESLLDAYESAGSFMQRETGGRSATTASASGASARFCAQCGARYSSTELVCPADGEVLLDDPLALIGTTLDGLYEIEELLGQGGFGAVYLARHALLRDRVAVKVLRRDLSANPDLLRRFLREGRAARAIRHPNVVFIHDLRTTGEGLAYMVLEFVEGRTLRAELKRGGLFDAAAAAEIVAQIAAALDAAHAQGIVHRDLKPENVMIGGESGAPAVTVLDLGLAKLREVAGGPEGAASELTHPGQRMGSPQYMSPEQWGWRPRDGGPEVDTRSDVYSLGVIAYEMVTGGTPFAGDSMWELRRAHLESDPAPAHERNPGLPEAFGRAIARAVARDRADRYATAGAFAEDLRAAAEGRPLAAGTASDVAPAGARGVSKRALGLALGAALALGALGVWWALPSAPSDAASQAAGAAVSKPYAAMTDAERIAFVDERVRQVSRVMAGREYNMPPDVRLNVKRQVDRYAARVGNGVTRGGTGVGEDLIYVFDRGRRHAPHVASVFAGAGVPPMVGLYIATIESEFDPGAVSKMGARGMFQILPATAEKYGVPVEDLDDVGKAAPLAARYVKDRMADFGDDPMAIALSVAAYNRGPSSVQDYLDRVVVFDDAEAEQRFWSLVGTTRDGSPGVDEGTRYVILFFAAAVVGENPAAFGLEMRPLSAYAGE